MTKLFDNTTVYIDHCSVHFHATKYTGLNNVLETDSNNMIYMGTVKATAI
jgi:hypothetical protein